MQTNILLSIKPMFVEKILRGEKKYEFRRQKPKCTIEKIYIYQCHPSKNIVGWFSIKKILSDSPEKIWKHCENFSGIKKEEYFTYCNGVRIMHAFEIDDIFQFKNPIDPFTVISNFKPPQNFRYLEKSLEFNELDNRGGFHRCLKSD